MPIVIDSIGPDDPTPGPAAFATATDYENFTGQRAPDDIERLLLRASEAVADSIVISYDLNNADQSVALRDATCAVAEKWQGEFGDFDLPDIGPTGDVSLGELSIKGTGASGPGLPPRARRILSAQGLLYRGVDSY